MPSNRTPADREPAPDHEGQGAGSVVIGLDQKLTAVYAEARDEYLRTVQPPRLEDFPCRYCKADVGEPCTFKKSDVSGAHRPRETRWSTAYRVWAAGAIEAGDDAVNALGRRTH